MNFSNKTLFSMISLLLIFLFPAMATAQEKPWLCVFDYDLTISSNKCELTEGKAEYHCLTTSCFTYTWKDQCLGIMAKEAIATCVERNAYIGIASHATVDDCWEGKVIAILRDTQFID